MKTFSRRRAALSAFSAVFVLSLALAQAPCGYAQTPAQPGTQEIAGAQVSPEGSAATVSGPEIPPAVAKALAAMQARIEQLEAELKARTTEQRSAQTTQGPTANAIAETSLPALTQVPAVKEVPASAQAAVDSPWSCAHKEGKDRAILGLGLDLAERQPAQQRRGL